MKLSVLHYWYTDRIDGFQWMIAISKRSCLKLSGSGHCWLKCTIGFVHRTSQWRISIMRYWKFHSIVYTHYLGCTSAVYVDVQWSIGNTSIRMTISYIESWIPHINTSKSINQRVSFMLSIDGESNALSNVTKFMATFWKKMEDIANYVPVPAPSLLYPPKNDASVLSTSVGRSAWNLQCREVVWYPLTHFPYL